MSCYFDDVLLHFPYNHYIEIGCVTLQEYEAIRGWHEALNNYQAPQNDNYNTEAILADPKWREIVKAGEQAKAELASLLTDEERKILTENINYTDYI